MKIPAVIEHIKKQAAEHGWNFIAHQEKTSMLSFNKKFDYSKKLVRINIYYTSKTRWIDFNLTVGTYMDHPKKGKTQLFRKNVDSKLLTEILKNPRVHTKRGYRKK